MVYAAAVYYARKFSEQTSIMPAYEYHCDKCDCEVPLTLTISQHERLGRRIQRASSPPGYASAVASHT